jgi:hypothetical protein
MKVKTKFAPVALIPSNAIDEEWLKTCKEPYILETMDGKIAEVQFVGAYNNQKNDWEAEFDDICEELYGMKFATVKANYKARLGYLSPYWFKITMK